MSWPRRLAAIVFTDLVGYTGLAQTDESAAIRLLQDQDQLVDPILKTHHGRRVKSMGDGLLLEFPNALEAVEFGVSVQKQAHELAARAGGPQLTLRIGIHLGDVQEIESDILGDAVNIASRIEPLSEPGGVCVSEPVAVQVRNKLPYQFDRIGPQALKGVREPMVVYRILLPWGYPRPAAEDLSSSRLAVLPLANMSPDPADEYFAEGLTEELITHLSEITDLRVIARTSVMRYRGSPKGISDIGRELRVGRVLEGSVRKSGSRLRVTAQLIDVQTEEHLWSHQYDRQLADLLDLQTEISQEVAAALRLQLAAGSIARSSTPSAMSAYTGYLRAKFLKNRWTTTAVRSALEAFEQVVQEDPRFARAYAGIADCSIALVGYDQIREAEGMSRARTAARRALELEPNLPEGHVSLANVLVQDLDLGDAERHLRTAIELQPGLSDAHFEYSDLLATENRLDEAMREAELAEEFDPVSPTIVGWIGDLAWARGDTERALRTWKEWSRLSGLAGRFDRMSYYALANDRAAANAELNAMCQTLDPHVAHWKPWWQAFLAGVLGEREEAEARMNEYLANSSTICSHRWVPAAVLGTLPDHDRTFKALGRPEDHVMGVWAFMFRIHPAYKKLREDPRFAEYIRAWDPPADVRGNL